MVVDSTISASGEAYSSTPSWTRLLAQTTTSASPMSFAPRIVNRSGEPGPAPINQTSPMSLHPSAHDDRRPDRHPPPLPSPPRPATGPARPGPAPINQTLPMSLHLSAKDDRRQVRPLAPGHLGRRDYFFARDPEPRAVDRPPANAARRRPRPLAPGHLGRRDYFFARDPEPRAVDRAPEPPGLLSHPEHLGHPPPAPASGHALDARP